MFTKYLTHFVDKGIPMIRTAQQNQTDRYLNLTTISIFLSAVTASTLQIEGQGFTSKAALSVAVNSFLFSSLIFSTASAVQSMLAMAWLRSFVRLPRRHLPLWASTWLMEGPTVSLLIAGAFFSMGLVLFVFASKQDTITSAITTSFASMQAIGFLFLTVWFYRELWLFRLEGGDPGQKVTKFSIVLYTVEFLARLPLAGKAIWKGSGRVVDFIRWSFMQPGDSKHVLDVADERGGPTIEATLEPSWVPIASPEAHTADPGDPQIVSPTPMRPVESGRLSADNLDFYSRPYRPSKTKRVLDWFTPSAPEIEVEPPSRPASVMDVFALSDLGNEDMNEGPEDPTGQSMSNRLPGVTSAFGGMIVDEPLGMIEGDSSYMRSELVTEIPIAHSNGQVPLQNPRRRRMGRHHQSEGRDRLSPGPNEHVNSVSVVEMRTFGLI